MSLLDDMETVLAKDEDINHYQNDGRYQLQYTEPCADCFLYHNFLSLYKPFAFPHFL